MSETLATRAATAAGLDVRVVSTAIPASAEESAALQGLDVGALLRTIVVRRAVDDFVFVLVPGGRQIDWKRLRAHLGQRRLSLPDAEEARRVTGYERGAITPFASAHAWPVVADASIAGRGTVAIGAGARGVNMHIDADALLAALAADVADVADPIDTSTTGEPAGA